MPFLMGGGNVPLIGRRAGALAGGGGGLSMPEGALFDWDARTITAQADATALATPWVDGVAGAEITGGAHYRDGSDADGMPSGEPYLHFSAGNQALAQSTLVDTGPYSSWSVAVLLRHEQVVSTSYIWRGDASDSSPYIRTGGSGFIVYAGNDETVFGNSHTGSWKPAVFSNDAGALTLLIDGVEYTKAIGTTFPVDGAHRFGSRGGVNNSAIMRIGRFAFYDRALDAAERADVETILSVQAGL